jgi:hypothetical protein
MWSLREGAKLGAAILVVLSLVMSSAAKEKEKGAEVFIQKKDGQGIKAELLAVKEGRIILMDSFTQSEVIIAIDEIKSIQIAKKAKFFQGLGLGFLAGGALGAAAGFLSGDDQPGWFSLTAEQKAVGGGLAFGVLGASIGGIAGVIKGIDESIDLEGRSSKDIQSILKKLDAKSRFPQHLPQNLQRPISIQISAIESREENEHALMEQSQPEWPSPQKASSAKFTRFHLTFRPGYFLSQGVNKYTSLFKEIGFGDTEPAHDVSFLFFSLGTVPATEFPRISKRPVINFGEIRVEYSLTCKFAVGVGYSSLGEHEVTGYKLILIERGAREYYSNLYLIGNYSGDLYYFMGSWMPVPDAFIKKSSFKLGMAVGWSNLRLNYRTSKYTHEADDQIGFSKNTVLFMGRAEFNYYFNKNWSLGLNVEYRYAPAKIESFHLTGFYYDLDENSQLIESSLPVTVPGHAMNFGGYGFGTNFSFHF